MSVIPQPQEIAFQWKSGDLSSRNPSSLSSPGEQDHDKPQSDISGSEPSDTNNAASVHESESKTTTESRQSSILGTPTSVHSTPVCTELLGPNDDDLSRVRSAPPRAANRANGWGAALSFDAVATPQRRAIGSRWQVAVGVNVHLMI